MPIFEYECKKCGHQFEALLKSASSPAPKCPECGAANPKGAVFCSKCGVRLSEAKPQDEDDYTQEELLDFAEEIMDEDDDTV